MLANHIMVEDVAGILSRTQSLWADLRGASILITGATGFVGTWLLETILAANREFSLKLRVVGLSRDPAGFAAKAPHLAVNSAVTWIAGDVRNFVFPAGDITHIVHAATAATSHLNASDPQAMFDVCVEGTRRVLELATEKRASRMLFTSSGAVYGRQPPEISHLSEDHAGGPDPLDRQSAYAEGKRAAEFLCCLAASRCESPVPVSVARCFAFVGPHLPLDAHFAIGNFIRDVLAGGLIRISGDGTPCRSYLYAADLAESLVTILLRGRPGRGYNVGSDDAISIRELANRVAAAAADLWPERPPVRVEIAQSAMPDSKPARYVPCCFRARHELGLAVTVPLDTAIRRSLLWYGSESRSES